MMTEMTTTAQSEAKLFSLLDSRPVVAYDPDTKINLVYWNGIPLTLSYALIIYSKFWANISSSPQQRIEAFKEYKKFEQTKFLDTHEQVSKDYTEWNFVGYLMSIIPRGDPNFWVKLRSEYSSREAFSWFINGVA